MILELQIIVTIGVTLLLLIVTRVIYLVYLNFTNKPVKLNKGKSILTFLCLGSGGHTAELFRLLENLDLHVYHPRIYISADNDVNSFRKVLIFESKNNQTFEQIKIPRSRNVKQSYISSVLSTLQSIIYCIPILLKYKPNLILCNGPGTCVPLCFVAFIMKCLYMLDCRLIFIESVCRVQTLSLSGKILQPLVDIFIVQWPQLMNVCYRAKYFGRLT